MSIVYMDIVNSKQITIVLERDEWLTVYMDEQYVDQCINYNEAIRIVEKITQAC